MPERAFIEEEALEYPTGRSIAETLASLGVTPRVLQRGQRPDVAGIGQAELYRESKSTLVVRVWKRSEFAPCRPSADYQLPLVSSCPHMCEYCYLQTRLGPRPYIRVYANVEEVLNRAAEIAHKRSPALVSFEGAATSDPVAVEHISGLLRRSIEFFGSLDNVHFRFVTKSADVGPILGASHFGKTRVRFSVNTPTVIRKYEHKTANLEERLEALLRVRQDGYPVGIMVGPVILYEEWEREYEWLLLALREVVGSPTGADDEDSETSRLPVEVITHRFTERAKRNILSVFPNTGLPMNEDERRFVRGQFGYGKYVYPEGELARVREFFETRVRRLIPGAWVEYVV